MKYYVSSCDMRVTILADNPKDAVKKAIKNSDPDSLGYLAHVSETGFESSNPNDYYVLIPKILLELDMISKEEYDHFLAMIDEARDGLE